MIQLKIFTSYFFILSIYVEFSYSNLPGTAFLLFADMCCFMRGLKSAMLIDKITESKGKKCLFEAVDPRLKRNILLTKRGVSIGHRLELRCTDVGKPRPYDFYWFKNNELIMPSKKNQRVQILGSSLIINKVRTTIDYRRIVDKMNAHLQLYSRLR